MLLTSWDDIGKGWRLLCVRCSENPTGTEAESTEQRRSGHYGPNV